VTLQRILPSTVAYSVVLIAIGIWGLAQFAFIAIWVPGIQPAALRAPMMIACSLISLLAGAGLLWPRYQSTAARMLLGFFLVWLIWCKGPALARSPADLAVWESLGETAVLTAAAWTLARTSHDTGAKWLDSAAGPRILYGLALIAFGASHLAYVTLTATLVPAWLPWHAAWVYLTAATYVAAGIALAGGRFLRTATALSALQMTLFGLLIWLPRVAAGGRDMDTMNEAAISFALAASGWVIAEAIGRDCAHPDS